MSGEGLFFLLSGLKEGCVSKRGGGEVDRLPQQVLSPRGEAGSGAMAAGGAGCGETVEQCRAEVDRLSRDLAEANREKIRAAECGLVVLEENQRLKQQYGELEAEQEGLRLELEQLQEVWPGSPQSNAVPSHLL